jgi:hypothetical protein
MKASAQFNKAIWAKLNPGGTTPAQPLVNDATAAQTAQAALALMSGAKYRFEINPNTTNTGNPSSGFEINQRLELSAGDRYAVLASPYTKVSAIRLTDPITGQPDPILTENIDRCCRVSAFNVDGNYIPYAATSAADMHLIVAEVALANNQIPAFQTAINTIRTAYGLPDWTPASTVTARAILEHERAVALFMQGRRLSDMYRFGVKATVSIRPNNQGAWTPLSDAFKRVGCFFSIPISERLSNPKVTAQPSCRQS